MSNITKLFRKIVTFFKGKSPWISEVNSISKESYESIPSPKLATGGIVTKRTITGDFVDIPERHIPMPEDFGFKFIDSCHIFLETLNLAFNLIKASFFVLDNRFENIGEYNYFLTEC